MKYPIGLRIFNAVLVLFLLACITQLSIDNAQALVELGSKQVVETTTETETITTEIPDITQKVESENMVQNADNEESSTTAEETTTVSKEEKVTEAETTTTEKSDTDKEVVDTSSTDSEYYTDNDITMLCKVTYGEAGNLSELQQAAVVWCILNRVDSSVYPNSISKVITQPYQFCGYSEGKPVVDKTKKVVIDVLNRWVKEKQGETDVGRVLPIEYMYFTGDGVKNTFRLSSSTSSQAWDWSLPSPYGN